MEAGADAIPLSDINDGAGSVHVGRDDYLWGVAMVMAIF